VGISPERALPFNRETILTEALRCLQPVHRHFKFQRTLL
jgi:hypothetical protein